MRRWVLRLAILNLAISALWFGWPFLKPARAQALDQQTHLVDRVAHRDWKEVLALLAGDYRDGWDLGREEAIALGHEMLQGFLLLGLEWKTSAVRIEGKTATVQGFLKASGSGSGLSSEIVNRLNQLREPFVFTWRKDGWKPGDWRLVSVRQPELGGGQP